MANRYVTLDMAQNVNYTEIAVVYAEVGDTVIATINGAGSSYHWAELQSSTPNGDKVYDDHGTNWTYTVIGADQDANYYVDGLFFSPFQSVDGTSATHSGRVRINVCNPIFTGISHNNAAAGNVTVTLSATPTHVGSSSGETLQYRQIGSTFVNSNTILQSRNTTKAYDIRLWTTGPVTFGGVSAAGEGDEYHTKSVTVPYLATDLAISNGGNLTTNNGLWTQTISGQGVNENYVVARLVGTQHIMLGKAASATTKLSTGVNGTSLVNDKTDNSPSAGNTDTYYIYGSRTSTSGGNGGQGIWDPGEAYPGASSGWELCTSGQSFTVTRTESFNEACSNATGTYFDTDADTGSRHRVTFTGLSSNYYYNVSRSGSSSSFTSAGAWFNVSGGTATRNPQDPAMTDPGGTNSTQKTFYLWRSSSSNGSSPTYTGVSYTRTIVSYERIIVNDFGITSGAAYAVEVQNTIPGHSYQVFDSGSSGGTAVSAAATATGTTTSINISQSIPSSSGDSFTGYIWHSSSLNYVTTKSYAYESYTVTRTGTGSGSGLGPANSYGMKIYSNTGSTLIDTQSRLGRVVTSGTVPTSGTLAASGAQDVSVDGMANNTLWNVMVVPNAGGSIGAGYQFTVVKAAGKFTLTNTSSTANSYKYYVVKSGS